MPEARRTFGPVVLLGIAGAGLAAVAGHKPWAASADERATAALTATGGSGIGESPAAGAFALVALACWGVLLVSRGRVRRVVAVLAVLAAAAVLVTVVVGWSSVPDGVRDAVTSVGGQDLGVHRTGWYPATAVGGLAALVAGALAVRLAPAWPEMGSRYDAPAGQADRPDRAGQADPGDRSSIDLWKDLDEGRDPTA